MDTLTEPQNDKLSIFNNEIKNLSRKLTIYEEEQKDKPPSYIQTRANNSLKFHQKELADLEKEFERKKQEHLDAIELAQATLASESAIVVRTRTRLRLITEERDKWLDDTIQMNRRQLQPQISNIQISTPAPRPPPSSSDPFGEWDTSGMSPPEIKEMVTNRNRRGETIPQHLLHHLRATTPPPAVPKPKKSIKQCRSVMKEVGRGVSTYQQPLDDD